MTGRPLGHVVCPWTPSGVLDPLPESGCSLGSLVINRGCCGLTFPSFFDIHAFGHGLEIDHNVFTIKHVGPKELERVFSGPCFGMRRLQLSTVESPSGL